MAVVGDRVQVPSKRVGQAPREGVVLGASASGLMLRVRWSSGEESTITPSMGSLVVVGRVRVRDGKVAGSDRSSTKSTKAVSKKAAGTTPKKAAKTPKDRAAAGHKGGGKTSGKSRAPKRGK